MATSTTVLGIAVHVPGSRQLVALKSSAIFLKSIAIAMAHPFFAGALAASLGASLSWTRLSWRFMVNSDRRLLPTRAALISMSCGLESQGEDSMLRISVDTRALDCE